MAEQNETAAGAEKTAAPVFRLEKLYVKDLSFESPNAPEVFFIQEQEPKVELNLKVTNKKVNETHWEVCVEISATINEAKSGKTMLIVEIEHAGAFLIQNIPEQHMEQVLNVDCPTIIFPYTRQVVSQASLDGGFMPFYMEPINFAGIYHSRKQKAAQQAEQQTS